MLYSAILPGTGQIYNEKYIKAGLLVLGDAYLLYQVKSNSDKYTSTNDVFYRDERNKYLWWSAGAYLFGLLDAYVDAHLSGFPKNDILVTPIEKGLEVKFSIVF